MKVLNEFLFNENSSDEEPPNYECNINNSIYIYNIDNKQIIIESNSNNDSLKFEMLYTDKLWNQFINLYYNETMSFTTILQCENETNLNKLLDSNKFVFLCDLKKIENSIKLIIQKKFTISESNYEMI